MFRKRELTEFSGKLGEFCDKLGEFGKKCLLAGTGTKTYFSSVRGNRGLRKGTRGLRSGNRGRCGRNQATFINCTTTLLIAPVPLGIVQKVFSSKGVPRIFDAFSSCVLGFFARGFPRKCLHWRGQFLKQISVRFAGENHLKNTEKHKPKLCAEVPERPLPKDPFFQLLTHF